jgi:hypothetical protein
VHGVSEMGLLILDIQHRGNPNRPDSYGAHIDLDGDGVKEAWEREAALTPDYAAAASWEMARQGHLVCFEPAGPSDYATRWGRAIALAMAHPDMPIVYAACHLNMGGFTKGLVFHDARSSGGYSVAHLVASHLANISELGGAKAIASYYKARPSEPADRQDPSLHWTRRALYTITGIYSGPRNLCGVCFEPWYLDNPDHRSLATPEGCGRVGGALAAGICDWFNQWPG